MVRCGDGYVIELVRQTSIESNLNPLNHCLKAYPVPRATSGTNAAQLWHLHVWLSSWPRCHELEQIRFMHTTCVVWPEGHKAKFDMGYT